MEHIRPFYILLWMLLIHTSRNVVSFVSYSFVRHCSSSVLLNDRMITDYSGLVAANLEGVRDRMEEDLLISVRESNSVRLVAVSKTKSVENIREAYEAGQRHFGENYVQEICNKAPELPSDIKWHFIGNLQSNKASNMVKSLHPNLFCVETVSSMKLAKKLNRAMEEVGDDKLGIFIQLNTSGEATKSGCRDQNEALSLMRDIQSTCPALRVLGLMTIGAPGETSDFENLIESRKHITEQLGLSENDLELSMGMSNDFEVAIQKGSTNIRVGSTIFGARDYSKK